MSDTITIDFVWWITAVELPVMGGFFRLIHNGRREADRNLLKIYTEIQNDLLSLLDNLGQYKLEVARGYVTVPSLKDVEKRLTHHLLRVEDRLIDAHPAAHAEFMRHGRAAGRSSTNAR